MKRRLRLLAWSIGFATCAPFAFLEVRAHAGVPEKAASALLKPGMTFVDCREGCPTMVVVGAGKFIMGTKAYARERPQHAVTIAAPFAVGRFDVTFDEWSACVKDGGCTGNPEPPDGGWGRGRRPVISVSWFDANDYTAWLSKKTGHPYRLLTEAEWEYADRAGTTTNYPWGDTIDCGQANYDGGPGSRCAKSGPAPVGSYPPNLWGLSDMQGNVWQWCEDSWHLDYTGAPTDGGVWQGGDASMSVLGGGAWNYAPSGLRSTDRNWLPKSARTNFLGFRVARPLDDVVAVVGD